MEIVQKWNELVLELTQWSWEKRIAFIFIAFSPILGMLLRWSGEISNHNSFCMSMIFLALGFCLYFMDLLDKYI